jgi:hypothetical protein
VEISSRTSDSGDLGPILVASFGPESLGPKLATKIGAPTKIEKKIEGSDFGRQFFATKVEVGRQFLTAKSRIFGEQFCPHFGPRLRSSLLAGIRLIRTEKLSLVKLS